MPTLRTENYLFDLVNMAINYAIYQLEYIVSKPSTQTNP